MCCPQIAREKGLGEVTGVGVEVIGVPADVLPSDCQRGGFG